MQHAHTREVHVTEDRATLSLDTEEAIRDFAITIADTLADTPASHTRVLDIRGISTLADYFVITGGENERQLRAISRQLADGRVIVVRATSDQETMPFS